LTVVAHEMGHVLGLPDLDLVEHPGDVMADALAPGIRRLPELMRTTQATATNILLDTVPAVHKTTSTREALVLLPGIGG